MSPAPDGNPNRDRDPNQDRGREPDPGGITWLDDATVDRIAAGEVVERPASVVKEVVENSLDANASRIAVSVRAGGTEGIRVRDDGVGIPPDELDAAVAAHATSKIDDADDLTAVGTLGFRGEALHTIGAVSRLTVRSRPRGAARGAELTVEGGDVGDVRPAGCPEGTVVEVADLFYNTPARREFLSSVATEFDHVTRVVTGYALANPDVAVSLEHDGRETFATPGDGDLRSAVLAVYGREVAEAMIDVGDGTPVAAGKSRVGEEPGGESSGPNDSDSPIRAVSGLVSHPETTRSNAAYLATYVNGRYVRSATLREAVLAAYGGQLAADRYPFAVLFVAVDPSAVDANVHPRKTEVRFDAEPAVRRAVQGAVRDALLDHGILRSTAPRGRSAPDETTVDADPPTGEAVGGAGADAEPSRPPGPSVSKDQGETDQDGSNDPAGDAPADSGSASPVDPADPDAWRVEGLGGGRAYDSESEPEPGAAPDLDAGSNPAADAGRPSPRNWQVAGSESDADPEAEPDPKADPNAGPGDDGGAPGETDGTGIRGPTRQRTLTGGETGVARGYDSLPRLRLLGQLHDTYVLAESPDGLVVIDQHAADERVNYERLRDAVDGTAQALAEPVTVELTAREAAAFADAADAVERLGFRAERIDDRTVRVDAVPAVFDAALDPELLREALATAVRDGTPGGESMIGSGEGDNTVVGGDGTEDDGEGAGTGAVADAADELLADLACYPAITGGTGLREGSMVELLDTLDDCDNPYACPHGRPTLLVFDREELAERFERDYPGHAGRRAE